MRRCVLQPTTRTVLSSRHNLTSSSSSSSSSESFWPGFQHQCHYQHPHQYQRQYQQYRWKVTSTNTNISKAKAMLGFPHDCTPTVIQLREAYYEAAKKCHPDVVKKNKKKDTVDVVDDVDDNDSNINHTVLDFRVLKDAYEYLLEGGHVTNDVTSDDITLDEENKYRRACLDVLGLTAEIVEESKQNSMFLHWLSGRSKVHCCWTNFFRHHGGLAPKLRPPAGLLTTNSNYVPKASESRRRRQGPTRRR